MYTFLFVHKVILLARWGSIRWGPVGPGGASIGLGFRASNNLFRGPCIKKVKKPCWRGFGLVSRAPLGRLVGPWGSRWGPVGPGGIFIDTRPPQPLRGSKWAEIDRIKGKQSRPTASILTPADGGLRLMTVDCGGWRWRRWRFQCYPFSRYAKKGFYPQLQIGFV